MTDIKMGVEVVSAPTESSAEDARWRMREDAQWNMRKGEPAFVSDSSTSSAVLKTLQETT